MGSSKETISGASFSTIYNKTKNPKELYINRLLQTRNDQIPMGYFTRRDDTLSIEMYFNNNKFIKTLKSKVYIFDPEVAIENAPHQPATLVSSTEITTPNEEDFIRADIATLYDNNVSIVNYTVNNGIIKYKLSNNYVGSTPFDDRKINKVTYISNGNTYVMYAFRNEFVSKYKKELHFVFEKIKNDGDTKPTKNAKRAFYKYGTFYKSFKEHFENNDIKDILYSFCAKVDDPIIDELYGKNEDNNNNNGGFGNDNDPSITGYYPPNSEFVRIDVGDGDIVIIRKDMMTYNETVIKDSDDNNIIAIPIEYYKEQNTVIKYEMVKKYFGLIFYSQKTVEVSFFQSFFFEFLVALVSVAIAFFTGGASLAINAMITTAIGFVLSKIDKNGILSTIFAIATLDFKNIGLTSIAKVINTVKIASTIVSEYNHLQLLTILKESKEIDEDYKMLRDEAYKHKMQFLYEPMREMSSLYELPSKMLYNPLNNLNNLNRLNIIERI